MKTGTKLLSIVSLSMFILTGCEKDRNISDKDNPASYFEYDGSKYSLTQAFIENWGEIRNGTYNLDLKILSNTFEQIEKNNLIDDFAGVGNGLYFEMFSSTQEVIDTTVFPCESTHFGTLSTFNSGYVYIGYDFINETGTMLKIIDGYIKVEQNDPEYEIIIECTVSNGNKINGYYKGSAKYYDYVTFF